MFLFVFEFAVCGKLFFLSPSAMVFIILGIPKIAFLFKCSAEICAFSVICPASALVLAVVCNTGKATVTSVWKGFKMAVLTGFPIHFLGSVHYPALLSSSALRRISSTMSVALCCATFSTAQPRTPNVIIDPNKKPKTIAVPNIFLLPSENISGYPQTGSPTPHR